jgi:hypothetical protein
MLIELLANWEVIKRIRCIAGGYFLTRKGFFKNHKGPLYFPLH